MATWTVAAVAGVLLAVLLYGWREPRAVGRLIPLIGLRALALAMTAALLLDAPAGPARLPAPLVALDVSQSWMRGRDSGGWHRALARARSLAPDSLLLFGDSARAGAAPRLPTDAATRIQAVAEHALGSGRPVVVLSDGEIDDPGAVRALPSGSRVELFRDSARLDLALLSVEAPAAAVAGDTIDVRATIRSGAVATRAAALTVRVGETAALSLPIDPLEAGAERTLALRVPLPPTASSALLALAVTMPGDAEAANDSLRVSLEIARAAGAVLVSTSPDLDARFLVPVLRGAVALPTRAYYRVAPGSWRREGTLAAVPEAEVRRALRDAPLAILHGDTALFGAPRSVTTGALALFSPPRDTTEEWYPVGAPASPIAGALSGIAWDSLPPLDVGSLAPPGEWTGLDVARARRLDRRGIIVGRAAGRRTVVVGASGFWRWRFRGGATADAYAALWGSIFDWLAAERTDARAAIPAVGVVRAGERVRWRRGSGQDSVVIALLRRRGSSRDDSVRLRFGSTGTVAESAPLSPGSYDVRVPGGTALLAVNVASELLPRTATVRAGPIAGSAALGDRPRLRDQGWAYLTVLIALCAEWLLRRRVGLR
ncbi:MAG: hypothetical protein M3068_07475 [Gemmatimonadota bacterium]|nr:hypothetical protein [Gemmatimonadota bacterium]